MSGPSNGTLAAAYVDLVNTMTLRERQLLAWQAGTFDGGDYGNGTYPITDIYGETRYYKCLARLQHEADLALQTADGAAVLATSAKEEAEAAAAEAQATLAAVTTAASTAVTKAAEADGFRQTAASHEANALTHRNAAEAAAASLLTMQSTLDDLIERVEALEATT